MHSQGFGLPKSIIENISTSWHVVGLKYNLNNISQRCVTFVYLCADNSPVEK